MVNYRISLEDIIVSCSNLGLTCSQIEAKDIFNSISIKKIQKQIPLDIDRNAQSIYAWDLLENEIKRFFSI